MTRCWIGLGSNLGDRAELLCQSLRLLDCSKGVHVVQASSIYETDPYGPIEQASFLNMVVEIETQHSPLYLLKMTQAVELELKRERTIHWGPRTIDLDILIYADKIIKMKNLIIPHPEISRRLFVLIPMREIAAELNVPGLNKSIQELCDMFTDRKGVSLWKQNNGVGEFGLFEN